MRYVFSVALLVVVLAAGCGLPGGGGGAPPPVDADPQEVQAYREQVQPILESTARDVARVANVDVSVQGGNVSVQIDPEAAQAAETEARQGLEELQAIDPPPGLEDTHTRLITSYEEGIPALASFIEAVQSGDAGRISTSVREDLPEIRRLLTDIGEIQGQLREASQTP